MKCPFAVYKYECDKSDCDRTCPIRIEAQRKEGDPMDSVPMNHHQTTILNPYHLRDAQRARMKKEGKVNGHRTIKRAD